MQITDPVLAGHAQAIRRLAQGTVENVVEIGRRLTEAKRLVGHGQWGIWLEQEFGWSQSSASNLMRVFEFATSQDHLKFATVANLISVSALYELSRKNVPTEARNEIIERAEAGEPIGRSQVLDVVRSKNEEILSKEALTPLDTSFIDTGELISHLRKVAPFKDDDFIRQAVVTVRQAVTSALLDIQSPGKRPELFKALRELLTNLEANREPISSGLRRLPRS